VSWHPLILVWSKMRIFINHKLHLLGCALLAACSGGSGGAKTGSASDFELLGLNVIEGQEWQINRPIQMTFSKEVDFATVNLNTISIVDSQGFGATGFFFLAEGDPTTVVFQPSCPTKEDFSDAGLAPFSTYRIVIHGALYGFTIRSTDGEGLDFGELRNFTTPNSTDPLDLFSDSVPGPPQILLLPERAAAGVPIDQDTPVTNVEIGGVRRFFGRDPVDQIGRLEPGLDLPINHYSLPENQVTFVVHFNQAVLATQANISNLWLEYFDVSNGEWSSLPAEVQLEANCTETGAVARLTPKGILPRNSELRVVLGPGFSDLTGDATTAVNNTFARALVMFGGLQNPIFPDVDGPEVDELLELFDEGGAGIASLEDTAMVFPVPNANWGGGRLEASFAFGGTGGPGGEFDWYIPPATDLVLDTTSDVIFGGPDGAQTGSQPVIGGIVDVRDMFLPATSTLILVGPNTCTILASRNVRILGEITLRGADNPGVGTLLTANQPESGALGHAGGGSGGDGSPLTTQSSPRGMSGNGAFNTLGLGGEGGEASYKNDIVDNRRGSGGGGGRLGSDSYYDHDGLPGTPQVRVQTLVGLDIERGAHGAANGTGAENGFQRGQGGKIGPSPFLDNDDSNNFLGTKITSDGQMILGELTNVWAGAGGGGGGDSVPSDTFPNEPFGPASDEKGAGGGGAAGGLRILAIGTITIGSDQAFGSIAAEGGTGGAGENSWWRIGGGSGGGSGGHIVLSSAADIVIYGRAETGEPWFGDFLTKFHSQRALSALGGQGGAGRADKGGSNSTGAVKWNCDRIPWDHFDGFTDIPPFNDICFNAQPDKGDADAGPTVGAGGDGGPGIIQLHVEDFSNLKFPTLEAEFGGDYGSGLDVTFACAPEPLGWKSPGETPDKMVPFFGRISMAQSRWIPLGLARVDGLGGLEQVLLRGLGGAIPHAAGETVDQEDALVGPETLVPTGYQISLDASGLAAGDSLYRDNPALLRRASVYFEDSANAANFQFFMIASADYDPGTDTFELFIDTSGPSPVQFGVAGDVLASLVPHTARVVSNGILDAYPADTNVELYYDATVLEPLFGGPDESQSYSTVNGDFTDDLGDLNVEHWDFIRFRTIFDLDTDQNGVDLTSGRPGLDSLRIQFEF
jgi:hypothetical protein